MNATLASHLSDLSRIFHEEEDSLSVYDSTREAILEGSVTFDSRNFSSPATTRALARAGIITKFGSRQQSVQYYILTPKGYDTLFPLGLGRSAN